MRTVFNCVFKTFDALPVLRNYSLPQPPLIKFERGMPVFDHVSFTCLILLLVGLEWLVKPKGTIYSGVFNEDLYVPIFVFLAPDKERETEMYQYKIMGLYFLFRNLFMLCSSYTPSDSNLKLYCLIGTSVLAILTFCYRLIIIKLMVKRKTVKFTPFILCLFMFSTAVLWFIASIVERDLFAAIPNGFASFLGAWQLILYAKYRTNLQPDI